jgi:hypothetical protein
MLLSRHIPRPNPKRLPERRGVTIAATIFCRDGMILCADTEATITDETKGAMSKIHVIVNHVDEDGNSRISTTHTPVSGKHPGAWHWQHNWAIGITGSGWVDYVSVFMQGFEKRIMVAMKDAKFDWIKFQEILETHTEEFFTKYVRPYADRPDQRPQAEMLIAVQTREATVRSAYRIHDNLILSQFDTDYVVGSGTAVFSYLAGELCRYRPMRETAAIAAYILKRVKAEAIGCGGNSHIVMIGADGTIETLTTVRIHEIETQQERIEGKFYGDFAEELTKAFSLTEEKKKPRLSPGPEGSSMTIG